MFFDCDILNAKILDVVALDQGVSDTRNKRGYHALSFRLEADTHLSFRGKTLHAGGGSLGYFPANLHYRRESVRDRMIVIHFDTEDYYSGSIELINIENTQEIKELFDKALSLWKQKTSGYYFETAACFYRILALARKENAHRNHGDIPKQILPGLQLLEECFSNPELTVNDMARESFVSEVYFRKLFRKTFGLSPREYLTGRRISYAISLLKNGTCNIQQIARQSGFSDPKYFSVVFKNIVGCSPRDYLYHWDDEKQR